MQDLEPLPTPMMRVFHLEAEEDLRELGEGETDGPGRPRSSEIQVCERLLSEDPLLENLDEGRLLNPGHFWVECGSFPQQMGLGD